ncbi:MAG: HAMP domain-containing histidine kinase [Alphaproteobacteria bacterium]|nr:HAMP domain-containing histidine kinase [Alphaproteobacteria bacterium]MCB9791985.1 HAMP domain-containing histidine kinase [Alphaproteobacteria bacterium]
MSIRARLALALVLLVLVTMGLAWTVTGRAVLRPFASAVFKEFVQQSVYVAERIEAGEDPEAVAAQTGLDLRVMPLAPDARPPRGARGAEEDARSGKAGRRGGRGSREDLTLEEGRGSDEWQHKELRGRQIMYRPGARSLVAVSTSVGWVVVRRELDIDAPARRGAVFLLLVAGAVGLGAVWLSVMATRPLATSQEAMERIAAGELDHRLEVRGPRELAAAAASFNAMADRVEAMLRREKELMAGISHELRTPLTRLGLEVELLRDAGVPERRVDAMAADLAEMERLIQEMLNISRLELGQQPLHRRPTKLRAVVDEALRQQPLPEHELVVEGEGETLELDRDLATRALGNLLSNARRYTPPGAEVRVRLEGARVSVLDRGPGVSEASLPRLFEPFFREDASRAKATGGLGLGLMIVAQVMRLHGGSVRAWNREGGGLGVCLDFREASARTSAPSA